MNQIFMLFAAEWHKLKYGLAVFAVMFAALYAWIGDSPHVLWWPTFLGLCYVAFLVHAFVADQQQGQYPFLLGMPVPAARIYWIKIITGAIAVIMVELLLWHMLHWFNFYVSPCYYRYIYAIPFLFLPLYAHILMNSIWSRQSVAEMILSAASFVPLAYINALPLFFYHPLFPRMYVAAAVIQFSLLLIYFNYRIWVKGIMAGRSALRYFIQAWLLMILIPVLQFALICGFTEIHFKIAVRQMEAAGFKMLDIPTWKSDFIENPASIRNREEAEKWLKHPDTVHNHRQFAKVIQGFENHRGYLYDPFISPAMRQYLYDAAKAYYYVGDKDNFFKIMNYCSATDYSNPILVSKQLTTIEDSPLNTPEFWQELLVRAQAVRSDEFLVNINAGSLAKRIHYPGKNFYLSISDWVMTPREYSITSRLLHVKPEFSLNRNWYNNIKLIENKLEGLNHGRNH